MTLVIALKVGDGVVLGADSASTITAAGTQYVNSYFNAEKLFNLVKGLPLGVLVYGLGGLANRSIGSLGKDLRDKLSDQKDVDWWLNPEIYTVSEAAQRVKKFFYDELYRADFPQAPEQGLPAMGFLIAGYSAGQRSSEVWQVQVDEEGACADPEQVIGTGDAYGIRYAGVTEACLRLIRGFNSTTFQQLVDQGMTPEDAAIALENELPCAFPTMPIQDAIDLVEYLEDMTCKINRFVPGYVVVAPPIDVAAITCHEGFRWVKRKHFYSAELNPELRRGS